MHEQLAISEGSQAGGGEKDFPRHERLMGKRRLAMLSTRQIFQTRGREKTNYRVFLWSWIFIEANEMKRDCFSSSIIGSLELGHWINGGERCARSQDAQYKHRYGLDLQCEYGHWLRIDDKEVAEAGMSLFPEKKGKS